MLLSIFLLSKKGQDTSHTFYKWHGTLAGNLIIKHCELATFCTALMTLGLANWFCSYGVMHCSTVITYSVLELKGLFSRCFFCVKADDLVWHASLIYAAGVPLYLQQYETAWCWFKVQLQWPQRSTKYCKDPGFNSSPLNPIHIPRQIRPFCPPGRGRSCAPNRFWMFLFVA